MGKCLRSVKCLGMLAEACLNEPDKLVPSLCTVDTRQIRTTYKMNNLFHWSLEHCIAVFGIPDTTVTAQDPLETEICCS